MILWKETETSIRNLVIAKNTFSDKKKWYSERRRKLAHFFRYFLHFSLHKKKWYSERRRKPNTSSKTSSIFLEHKKKWYSERRRKIFSTFSTFKFFIFIIIRRNDTLKGDGNNVVFYQIVKFISNKKKCYSERRRKRKHFPSLSVNLARNKKKWYSERRRKQCSCKFYATIFILIRRNDTLKGDGNFIFHQFNLYIIFHIRRNDTLKGDGNFVNLFTWIWTFHINKKKWYSERRRKPKIKRYGIVCIRLT